MTTFLVAGHIQNLSAYRGPVWGLQFHHILLIFNLNSVDLGAISMLGDEMSGQKVKFFTIRFNHLSNIIRFTPQIQSSIANPAPCALYQSYWMYTTITYYACILSSRGEKEKNTQVFSVTSSGPNFSSQDCANPHTSESQKRKRAVRLNHM